MSALARKVLLLGFAAVSAAPCWAQQSSSYRVREHVFNAGGHPADGLISTSTSYRVTLDAIGEDLAAAGPSGPSFSLDAGFVGAYPPPGEVFDLAFDDSSTLSWRPERSAGAYNVYRDDVGSLPGLGYGTCFDSGLPGTTAADGSSPPTGAARFYLVTVTNRLDEEGTKGFDSAASERGNTAPCP